MLRVVQNLVTACVALTVALAVGFFMTAFSIGELARWGTQSYDGLYAAPAPATRCGQERWAVKTLADKDVYVINEMAVQITIAKLVAIPAPQRSEMPEDARLPAERQVYSTVGFVDGFKLEADSDFHIVVRDLSTGETMVMEMPAPSCVAPDFRVQAESLRRAWESRFGKVTSKYKSVAPQHVRVEIAGVGFFDFIHGQKGVAKNGFELHPVLAWREAAAPDPAPGEMRGR